MHVRSGVNVPRTRLESSPTTKISNDAAAVFRCPLCAHTSWPARCLHSVDREARPAANPDTGVYAARKRHAHDRCLGQDEPISLASFPGAESDRVYECRASFGPQSGMMNAASVFLAHIA